MRKLEFVYSERQYRLSLDKINLFFGPSNCGKTKFSKYLEKGLSGSEKSMQLDSQSISKNQLHTKLITGNQNIVDELKLSAKSELGKMIKEAITDNFDREQLMNLSFQLLKDLQKIQEILNRKLHFLESDYNENFQCQFIVDDIFALIKSNFEILSLDGISDSRLREMYIKVIIQSFGHDQESFLIVDDIDEKIDCSQFLMLLHEIEKVENLTCLLFLKNPEFLYYIIRQYPVFLVNRNFITITDFIHERIVSLMNQNFEYPIFIDSDISMIEDSLYNNLLRELLSLISINNAEIFLENYEKNILWNREKTKFLRNFV